MRSITLSSLCALKQSLLLSWKTGWCNRSMNIFWLVDDQTSDCCGEKSGPVNEIISGLIQTDSHTEREGNKLQASASVLPPSKPVITPACNHTGTVKPAAHTHTRTYSDSNDLLCHSGAIVGLITNLINLCLFNFSCRIGGLLQETANSPSERRTTSSPSSEGWVTPVDQVLLIEVPAAPPSSPGPSEKPHRQAGGCPGVLFTGAFFHPQDAPDCRFCHSCDCRRFSDGVYLFSV